MLLLTRNVNITHTLQAWSLSLAYAEPLSINNIYSCRAICLDTTVIQHMHAHVSQGYNLQPTNRSNQNTRTEQADALF